MKTSGLGDKGGAILILSFGSSGTEGNLYLGEKVLCLNRVNNNTFAVITQRDIPNIPETLPEGCEEAGYSLCPFSYVEDFMKDYGCWHSTLWVVNVAKLFCQNNGFPLRAVVVAAPMHLRRAIRDAEKVGFDVVSGVSPQIKGWYEKKSLLPWTRSWWRWWIREIPLRLLPWWLYKRLTLKLK